MKSTELIMGMPITVAVAGGGDTEAKSQISQVFGWFRHVDEVYSPYKTGSFISRINRGELDEAKAPKEVREVLAACRQMNHETEGYFNAWHQGKLDPSGYVKGWAIALAAELLDKAGQDNYFVEAGGDLQARGLNDEGAAWKVGIRSPFDHRQVVKVLKVHDQAVATSGTYVRGLHIYNPHTGKEVSEIASLTVVGPDICQADVFATAAFAMGLRGVEWVAARGLDGYLIKKDGTAVMTPGINRMST